MIRALVVSGGGSKGSYAGGVSKYLIESGKKYDILIGTSTGALLCPLVAVEEMELLKTAFTTISQKSIFRINPFKVQKSQNGSTKISIDYWNVFVNMLFHDRRNFGDSSNFDKFISKFMTPEIYKAIRETNKDVIATVTNLTLAKAEYHSTRENDRETFIKWLHASSSVPPFMNIIEHDGSEYADGGLVEHTPLQEAINRGATDIDVIFLQPKSREGLNIEKIRNGFHYITRFLDIMTSTISGNEINLENIQLNRDQEINVSIYPTPRMLTNNSLVFDNDSMNTWWDEGYLNAKNSYFKKYTLSKGRKPKLDFDGINKPNDP